VTAGVTIRDVARPVTFEVEHIGETTNYQGSRHIAFNAKATINREDWGLNWNLALETGGWLVGRDMKLVVKVVADEVIQLPAENPRELAGAIS
jgi:polyisoprenoid-binding protein YceI